VKTTAAVLALALSACIGWTKTNTVAEVTFLAEQTIDYRQTNVGVDHCAEGNPIIGPCGQNVSPAAYFLLTSAVHLMVAAVLPQRLRLVWQGGAIVDQAVNLRSNSQNLRDGHAPSGEWDISRVRTP
jgi:hypothetical protein